MTADTDSTTHGSISDIYITSGSSYFTIVNKTSDGRATITNVELLDYEYIIDDLNVTVQAIDGGGLTASQPLLVQFYLFDANDNSPQFYLGRRPTDSYVVGMPENLPSGEEVVRTFVIDRDSSYYYSQVFFRLSFDDPDVAYPFAVDQEGLIYLTQALDYETGSPQYEFSVIAEDIEGLSDTAAVTVTVLDQNEFAPSFRMENFTIVLPEDTQSFVVIYTFNATDGDGSDRFGKVSNYRPTNLSSLFLLDVVSGDLYLNGRAPDYETEQRLYPFQVTATDRGGLSSTVSVVVEVADVNEFPPEFEQLTYTVSISENSFPYPIPGAPTNTLVRVSTTDRDGQPTKPTFLLHGSEQFSIDSDGYVILSTPLDYEESATYELNVTALEGVLSSTQPAVVTVRILNVNDNSPEFKTLEYTACVVEHSTPPPLVQFLVEDKDDGLSPLVFQTSGLNLPNFVISSNGELIVTQPLDYETVQSIHFEVSVTDGVLYSSANTTVSIYVIGINDIVPVFENTLFDLNVSESTLVGTHIELDDTLVAKDGDLPNTNIHHCVPVYLSPAEVNSDMILQSESQQLSYRLVEENVPFSITFDNITGHPRLQLLQTLDYETAKHEYTLTIVASDGTFESPTHARVRIHLVNEDDSLPVFRNESYRWRLFENSEQFTGEVLATDPDDIGSIRYSVIQLDNSQIDFRVDEDNGTVFSSGPFDFEQYPLWYQLHRVSYG